MSDVSVQPNGFHELLKLPASYREAAQYFDGVSRQAVKLWAMRQWVPVKHWPNLLRLARDFGAIVSNNDFRAWAELTGHRISTKGTRKILSCDWAHVEKRIRRYIASFTSDPETIDEMAQHGMLAMMEYGCTDVGYGLRAARNRLFTLHATKELTFAKEGWEVIEKQEFCFPSQESFCTVLDVLRGIEALPSTERRVMRHLAKGHEDYDIASDLSIEVQSVPSYKSRARRLLKMHLADVMSRA